MVTELKNSKFPDKGWTVNGLNYLGPTKETEKHRYHS